MSDAVAKIVMPNDLAACHALIEQFACTVTSQTNTIEEMRHEYEKLKSEYAAYVQHAYRNRSERYIDNPDQLRLDLGDTPDSADAAEGLTQAVEEAGHRVQGHFRRPRKPRNESLPEHLERYEVEVDVPDDIKNCPEHGDRKLAGYDLIETLEFEPPKLRVRVTKYPKYVCSGQAECGVASPERPTGLVEGDRYDSSIGAEIITAKYGFHLPVYRQQDLFAGSGWIPSRSTLLNILVACAFAIRPLVEHFKRAVLAGDIVGTDETRVTLLLPSAIPKLDAEDPKSRRIHEVFTEAVAEGRRSVTARMWAYRSIVEPLNVFDFTVSRHRDGPVEMLADFQGILQADCYGGFEGIAVRSDGDIRRAACVAHARRKVFDARTTYPVEASIVLAKFQQLYDIEDRAKTMSEQERRQVRQTEAAQVWASFGIWLESDAAKQVLGSSDFGKALGYLNNHWGQLQTYLSDGRVPIDNNDVEQLMKQIALGRKNWLFVGSVAAGERAADFFTLVSSALRNNVDVWAYIKDVLDRLLAGETDYAALRPDAWGQQHPESIREYRIAERRDRADRKQFRREARRKSRTTSPA